MKREGRQQPSVLHVLGDSKYGGGSVIVQRLAEFGLKHGLQVEVLTTDPVFQDALRKRGINVITLPCVWREPRPRDVVGLARLVAFLRRSRYTIVHTHTSKGGFIGRLAAHLAHVPVVLHTVHGFAFHERSGPYRVKIISTLERLAAKWCDAVVTVSQFHRDWALSLGIGSVDQIVAIPNGIPDARVRPTEVREATRAQLGIRESEYMLVATGRLASQKGFEYALHAVSQLQASEHPMIRLVIAGEGPLRASLESMIRELSLGDRVSLIGFREDVGNLLAAADAVVLPSLWEGLSISLLEAMAAGRPIVTTDIGSNREVVAEDEAALLVPPADPGALARAIARLIEDPAFANELGRKARQVYEVRYTEDRMLHQYHELYRTLLRRKVGESTMKQRLEQRPGEGR